jgi:hypothetical protein
MPSDGKSSHCLLQGELKMYLLSVKCLFVCCIKSSKQGCVVVCFKVLSFSSVFTQYQHILLMWDT